MSLRGAYYWPVALRDERLGEAYRMVECGSDGVPTHRVMVPKAWMPVSPVPQRADAPPVVSLIVQPGGPDNASVAVLALPTEPLPFAADAAEAVALGLGLELGDDDPSGSVAFRALAAGASGAGWVAVAHAEPYWLVLVALAPMRDAVEHAVALRIASQTFGVFSGPVGA